MSQEESNLDQPTAALREIYSPDQKVQSLDQGIRRLNKERSQILSHINAYRSATRKLPFELLAAILKYAAPAIDFERPKLIDWDQDPYKNASPWNGPHKYDLIRFLRDTLAAVSTAWYDAVYHTPDLWTSIAIKLSPRKMEEKLSLLSLAFMRSGHLSVDIEIRFTGFIVNHQYLTGSQWCCLRPVLTTHASRIRSLRLGDPPREFGKMFGERFANLEYLGISWVPIATPHHFSVDAASALALRRLSLKSCNELTLEWANVTSLDLSEVPVDICALILLEVRCSNITEYFCRSPAPPFRDNFGFSSPTNQAHNHMVEFGWQCVNDFAPFNDFVFTQVRLPALRTLYWYGVEPDQEDPFTYPSFFSQFSSTLTTLHLERSSSNEDFLKCLFSTGIGPCALILEDCDLEGFRAIWHMLDPEHWNLGENRPMIFPELRDISVVVSPDFGDLSIAMAPNRGLDTILVDMPVNRRKVAPDKLLRVHAANDEGFPWGEAIPRLQKLTGERVLLEIFEFGELHPACNPRVS